MNCPDCERKDAILARVRAELLAARTNANDLRGLREVEFINDELGGRNGNAGFGPTVGDEHGR